MRNYEDNFTSPAFEIDSDRAKIFECERQIMNLHHMLAVLMEAVAILLRERNDNSTPKQ